MKQRIKADGHMINRLQVLIGTAGLIVGSLVYLVDRPPDQTYFVFQSGINISLHDILPNLFGFIGNCLPAFIHVFSFILITAGLLSCNKKGGLIICLCWFFVDCTFEIGQKFSTQASMIIPEWFAGIPFLESSKNYFLLGTFDLFDLAAISLGAIVAYLVLLTTMERREA
jgi:hypothetical protein